MPLSPGDTLSNDHYRIERQLGRGGFGFVYLAQDTLLGQDVAIKELIPALVGDEAMLKRFLAEARATMRLRHKRIVGTHNVFSEGDNYYIVMEYMAGGSLEERLRERGQLPVDDAVHVAAEVCEGLGCAHEEGVVHCDLKPANILFDASGSAKVADFGIAHVSGEMLTRTWMTPAGFVAGTLPYMSPEQAAGVRDDPRVDVYALGAVLYRMLTGRTYLAFDQRETPVAQADNVNRIRSEQPSAPSAQRPEIPQWLDGVVLKALAKRPEERFATVDGMRAALADPPTRMVGVGKEQAAAVPLATETSTTQPRRSNRLTWILGAAAAAVLLVIVIAGGLLVFNRRPAGIAVSTPPIVITATFTSTPEAEEELVPTAMVVATATIARTATLPPTVTLTPAHTSTPILSPTFTRPSSLTPTPTSTPTATAKPTVTPTAAPSIEPGASGRIAFHSMRDGDWEVYVMNADGSGQTRLTDNPAVDWWAVWSPNGNRIAFTSERDGKEEIYSVNADGSGLTRLTDNPARDFHPTWSPDGNHIAFVSERDGNREIYVMNADGSGPTRLTDNPASALQPSWSPDGKRIAFLSERDGSYEIYVMNADGSGLTRLTENAYGGDAAAWSPNGSRIAFASERDGSYEIYVMNADGSGLTRLTDSRARDINPAWSPDGTRIAFESERDGNKEIYVMNADGTGLARLTHNRDFDWNPTWSPDGTHIVFDSDRDGKAEIYVMNADGSDQTRLTDDPAPDASRGWSP